MRGLGIVLIALAAGCTERGLTSPGDGGVDAGPGNPCEALDQARCQVSHSCVLLPGCCGAAFRCEPVGTPPVCTVDCVNPCAGLDELSCGQKAGCRADYCQECACTPTFVGCKPASVPPDPCPGVGCDPQCSCDGLDEMTCLAESKQLGCTAEYCPDCLGGQYFVACLGPASGAGACPAVCPAGCRTQADCAAGICTAPGESLGCGVCAVPNPTCTSDGQCKGGQICDVGPCNCTGDKGCIDGCNTTGCGDGLVCGNSNRCIPISCGANGSCAANFDCLAGQCMRRKCSGDTMCKGYCVKGQCYDMLGTCGFPPS